MNLPVNFFVGTIANIELEISECDAAFVFNVLHHEPKWAIGIQEIARILKPSGYVIFEEPTKKYTNFTDKLARNKHPDEAKFTREEFIDQLAASNLNIIEDMSKFFGLYLALLCRKE